MKLPLIAGITLAAAVIVATVVAGQSFSDKAGGHESPSAEGEQTVTDQVNIPDKEPDNAVSLPSQTDPSQTVPAAGEENGENGSAEGTEEDKANNGAPVISDGGVILDPDAGNSEAPDGTRPVNGTEDDTGAIDPPVDDGDPAHTGLPGDTTDTGEDAGAGDGTSEPEASGETAEPGQDDTADEDETGDEGEPGDEVDLPAPETSGSSDDTPEVPDRPPVNDGDYNSLAAYFAAIAENELGVTEKKYNNVKYNTWYYGHEVVGKTSNSYAWCVAFISWCANEAGISTKYIPKTASVSTLKNFFSTRGLYTAKTAGISVGDIVFFGTKQSSPSHAGIVVDIEEDGTIVTIEGNYSDKVSCCRYAPSSKAILGYGTPACFQ